MDPVVKVTVVEYHSRPIAVMGAVKKPVTFQAVGVVTLLDALASAEGLNDRRHGSAGHPRSGRSESERIPVKRLMKDADPAVNFVLHGGEEIRVPEAGKIFVVGNVQEARRVPGARRQRESVLKMVALAEGLAPFRSRSPISTAATQAARSRRSRSSSKKS